VPAVSTAAAAPARMSFFIVEGSLCGRGSQRVLAFAAAETCAAKLQECVGNVTPCHKRASSPQADAPRWLRRLELLTGHRRRPQLAGAEDHAAGRIAAPRLPTGSGATPQNGRRRDRDAPRHLRRPRSPRLRRPRSRTFAGHSLRSGFLTIAAEAGRASGSSARSAATNRSTRCGAMCAGSISSRNTRARRSCEPTLSCRSHNVCATSILSMHENHGPCSARNRATPE
jgi:hypothetical protein